MFQFNKDRQEGFEEGLAQVENAIEWAVKKLRKETRRKFMRENLSWSSTHSCNCDSCEFN